MSQKLHNYLRTFRKRCGLSQSDVAFLLGCEYGTKISRYERHARIPTTETLFALEAVFQAPARDLYAGLYEQVEQQVVNRAKLLKNQKDELSPSPTRDRKVKSLEEIISAVENAH